MRVCQWLLQRLWSRRNVIGSSTRPWHRHTHFCFQDQRNHNVIRQNWGVPLLKWINYLQVIRSKSSAPPSRRSPNTNRPHHLWQTETSLSAKPSTIADDVVADAVAIHAYVTELQNLVATIKDIWIAAADKEISLAADSATIKSRQSETDFLT
jgi:hypothetical protein